MTTEFKVGDRVRRIQDGFADIKVGDEGTITEIKPGTYPGEKPTLVLKEYDYKYGFTYGRFELVEPAVKDLTVAEKLKRDEKLGAAKRFMDARLLDGTNWVLDPVAEELSDATGSFVVLTQRDQYTLSNARREYARNTEKFNAWFDKHVAPTLTNQEEIVSDLYDSDGNAVTLDAYTPALLPLFTKLAEEADRKGYCREYDAIAAVAGVPSRAEIKELNKPPVPTHGLEAFRALEIGDEFTVTPQFAPAWRDRRFKINDRDYLFVRNSGGPTRVERASGLVSTDKIEKVTR